MKRNRLETRCLVWTGPRMVDIQDCEKRLFAGSITIFGESPEKIHTIGAIVPDCEVDALSAIYNYDVLSKDGKIDNKSNVSVDGDNRITNFKEFNTAFWKSKMYYNNVRVNHNTDDILCELFIFTEQIKLLAFEKKWCDVLDGKLSLEGLSDVKRALERTSPPNLLHRPLKTNGGLFNKSVFSKSNFPYPPEIHFMSYNPHYAVRTGEEECVFLLGDLLDLVKIDDESELKRRIVDLISGYVYDEDGVRYRRFIPKSDIVNDTDGFRVDEFRRIVDAVNTLKNIAGVNSGSNSQEIASAIGRYVGKRTICLNSDWGLMEELEDKAQFRSMCRSLGIPTTEFITVLGSPEEASITSLKRRLGGDKYIVQRKISSGGFGTFLFEDPSANTGLSKQEIDRRLEIENKDLREVMGLNNDIQKSELYILSRYRDPNISLNVHAVVGPNEILISPYSVQVISIMSRRLIYGGADYLAFRKYADEEPWLEKTLDTYVNWICKFIQGRGYRGVIGFDILVSDRKIEFVEANNRFQASTMLLNRSLMERKYMRDNQGRVKIRPDSDVQYEEATQALDKDDRSFKEDNYKRIVIQDRKPSVQMLNLFAFENETIPDGPTAAELNYRRCYPNWKWRDVQNSRDGGGTRFPMTSPDFHTTEVPFSCYIYYNGNSKVDRGNSNSTYNHAINMIDCVNVCRSTDLTHMDNELVESNLIICREMYKILDVNENKALLHNIGKLNGFRDFFNRADYTSFKLENLIITYDNGTNTIESVYDLVNILEKIISRNYFVIAEDKKLSVHLSLHGKSNEIGSKDVIDIEPIRHVMDRYTYDCVDGIFKEVNYDCTRIENINTMCEYLTSLLNSELDKSPNPNEWVKFNEYLEDSGKRGELSNNNGMSDSLFKVADSLIKMVCAGDGSGNISEIIRSIAYAKFSSMARLQLFKQKSIRTVAEALEEWDAFSRKTDHPDYKTKNIDVIGLWNRFYKLVLDNSSTRSYRSALFDKVGKDYYTSLSTRDLTILPDSYLYKVLFRRNIVSCTGGRSVIHPNIQPFSDNWLELIRNRDALAIKIALINNGIRFENEISNIRKGVNHSVDLTMDCSPFLNGRSNFIYNGKRYHNLPINCAYQNDIALFSPFTLGKYVDPDGNISEDGKLVLRMYGEDLVLDKRSDRGPEHGHLDFDKDCRVFLTPHYRCNFIEKDYSNFHVDYCAETENTPPHIIPLQDSKLTSKMIPYSEVGFIATDRIRFQHNCECDFAKKGIGCKFCEMTLSNRKSYSFGWEDIKEVINKCLDNSKSYMDEYMRLPEVPRHPVDDKYFDHVLIGGGTLLNKVEMEGRIVKICEEIKSKSPSIPIYLMSIPPTDHSTMRKFRAAGITEVGFNIEIFDRKIASNLMPGKSRIPLSEYISTLRYAVGLWTKPGSVRSALILGLEPLSSTLEGIRVLSSIGVSPILSIFRPVPGTQLEHIMPLSSEEIYNFYIKADYVMHKAGQHAGPTCIHCQNNVLALPDALMPSVGER